MAPITLRKSKITPKLHRQTFNHTLNEMRDFREANEPLGSGGF